MFIKRLCSTIVLLGIFSCIIFGTPIVSKISFFLLGAVISFFLPFETCNMLKSAGKKVFVKYTSFVSLFFFLFNAGTMFILDGDYETLKYYVLFGGVITALFLLILPWILLLFIIGKEGGLERILNSYGILLLFIPALFSISLIYFFDVKLFLFFVIGTKIGDIGAYIIGVSTHKLMKNGNHKMIPSISPGKSWEGAAGGLLFSIVFAVSMYRYAFIEPIYGIWFPIMIGTILFVFGAAGDLAESCIKRTCGIKDSGHTIPGIGGVFDLADSLLLNSVIFTFILLLFG